MLKEIVEMFEHNNRPLNVSEMAAQLGTEVSALEGMLEFLVRKGTLVEVGGEAMVACQSCGGAHGCPYTGRQPRSYTLARK